MRYVLEGSVRKVGERVRVNAQLVEAESATHIWAETFDRDLAHLLDMQDEITEGSQLHPCDPGAGPGVPQSCEPPRELGCLANLDQA